VFLGKPGQFGGALLWHVLADELRAGVELKVGVSFLAKPCPWSLATRCQTGMLCFFFGRSHDAVIRVYDDTGNVIETHEHMGDFKEW
jgi:hypothetical protein